MNPFLALQGFLALPYFLLGLAMPFVLWDTSSRSHAEDLEAFRTAFIALALVWIVAFAVARRLVRTGQGAHVSDTSHWTVFLPVTVRLFTIAAPVGALVGFGAGGWLFYVG